MIADLPDCRTYDVRTSSAIWGELVDALQPTDRKVLLALRRLGSSTPSSIGYEVFPAVTDANGIRVSGPRNNQGAALAVGRWISRLKAAGLVTRTGSWRWTLSWAGGETATLLRKASTKKP